MNRIDKIELNMRDLGRSLKQTARGGRAQTDPGQIQKSFGEKPPKRADISKDPLLSHLFSERGLVGWLEEKLRQASRHDGKIIPAHDINAMAMPHLPGKQKGNLVFLGVDFAKENHKDVDLIGGVLAHEWGHLVSNSLAHLDPNQLSVEQVFNLRRQEEAFADAIAGRLIHSINLNPNKLIQHILKNSGQQSAKYHDVATRIAIIQKAFDALRNQQEIAYKIFGRPGERHAFSARNITTAY